MGSFLTCSVSLLMMRSECVWAFGEGSNFQSVRGPQNWVLRHFQAEGAVWPKKLCSLWSCPFVHIHGLEIGIPGDSYLNAHFSKPMAVLGMWVALNYLDTSFVCITGLVSALGQYSNGLRWIMHSSSACALSCHQPLPHCPGALKPPNAHKLVFVATKKIHFLNPQLGQQYNHSQKVVN